MLQLRSRRGRPRDRLESLTLRRLVALLAISAAMLAGLAAPATPAVARLAATKIELLLDSDLLTEINAVRAAHLLPPIRICPSLSKAADQHVRDMGRQGYFSHDSAGGGDFSWRIGRYYTSAGFRHWSVGENLLWSAHKLTARAALRTWMHSPPHRANLLSRGWRQLGISARRFVSAPGVFHRRRVWIVAIDFGVRY
jgi:uncharacterized protein YkwD